MEVAHGRGSAPGQVRPAQGVHICPRLAGEVHGTRCVSARTDTECLLLPDGAVGGAGDEGDAGGGEVRAGLIGHGRPAFQRQRIAVGGEGADIIRVPGQAARQVRHVQRRALGGGAVRLHGQLRDGDDVGLGGDDQGAGRVDIKVAVRLQHHLPAGVVHQRPRLPLRLAPVGAVADQRHGLAQIAFQQLVAAGDSHVVGMGDDLGQGVGRGLPAQQHRFGVQQLADIGKPQAVGAGGEGHGPDLAHHGEVPRVDGQLQVLPIRRQPGGGDGMGGPGMKGPSDGGQDQQQQGDGDEAT